MRGNALALPLADASVDLVVTSPPYFALRSYQDGGEHYDGQVGSEETPRAFLEALWAVTAECARVLKPTGSMFVNLGDSYSRGSRSTCDPSGMGNAGLPGRVNITDRTPTKSLRLLPERFRIGCVDQLGLVARAVIVWNKPNGLPESVTDRVRRSHEDWVHLTKRGNYYAGVDPIREPHAEASLQRAQPHRAPSGVAHQDSNMPRSQVLPEQACNPLGRLPGSVWTIASDPLVVPDHLGVDHYAAFPQEWPRRLILGWSPSGICTACGEGRRPAVVTDLGVKERVTPRYTPDANHGGPSSTLGSRGPSATITGYSCACPSPDASTRPAVVLDPMAGTGTVPMVARALGRFGVGIDLSADYLRLARWRVFESGHASKTRERTNREAQEALL